jgi:hypothetical protein
LLFYLCGYPAKPGNQAFLENVGTGERLQLGRENAGEGWVRRVCVLPGSWRGSEVKLVCVDATKDMGGWFAISKPRGIPALFVPWFGFWEKLHGFLTVGLIVLLLAAAMRRTLLARVHIPECSAAAVALVCVASMGYVELALAFFNPALARIGIAAAFGWALVAVLKADSGPTGRGASQWRLRDAGYAAALSAAIGTIYFSLLLGYSPGTAVSGLPGTRYYEGMVSDNEIPQFYAGQLWEGRDARAKYGDWQSSDRPPLQAGWVLLVGAPVSLLNGDFSSCAQYAGIWFQLIWVAAAWHWLRAVGLDRRGALAVVVAVTATGVFAFNTVYVWPKMGAAALLLVAYTLLFESERSRAVTLFGGLAAALALLAHGGVAFAFLGLIPFALHSVRQKGAGFWLKSGAAGALVMLPWLCYQKYYDPPGNRLPKWHLAGVIPPDSRSFASTLVSSYRHVGWSEWLRVREINYQTIMNGSLVQKVTFGGNFFTTRVEESFYFLQSLGWWGPAAVLVLGPVLVGRGRTWDSIRRALLWIALTLVVWGAVMFIPGSTVNHQGTYACQLVILLALGGALWRFWKVGFWLVAGLQAFDFIRVWVPPTPVATARTFLDGPMLVIFLCLAVLVALCCLASGSEAARPASPEIP